MNLPTDVSIVEVGPRDGLQAEARFIPTSKKIELVNALSIAATPTIYAIGTMTTVFSLAIIFTTFLVVYFMARRRRGLGLKKLTESG